MLNLTLFLFTYILIIFSVLGYGVFFEKIFYDKSNSVSNIGYTGLIGVFFLIIYSYFSHFFIAHGYFHNVLVLLLGLIIFFYFSSVLFKKLDKFFFTIFILLFFGLILFKTHDDFPYYHFPYTYYLVENKLVIGVGQFNHGFKTPSSIFYLNSLFYLPVVKYYTFYFSAVIIMGFSNLVIISKIIEKIKEKNIDNLFYFYLIIIIFINIFFYRIQEHGTDRSAQILIFLIFVELLIFVKFQKNNIRNISNLFLLLGLVISLKSFYILYGLILFPILFILIKEKKLSLIKDNLSNKFFLSFLLLLILIVSVNFFNSGCLVYPVSQLCFDLQWSLGPNQAEHMNQWYQQWSKAGASPNFRVENPEIYIKNFNWVSNWINIYFFNKVSDFLLGIIFLALIMVITFYKSKRANLIINKNNLLIYFSFLILFLEWFYNHPALRYGGYCLISIILFYPISVLLAKFNNSFLEINKKVSILFIITIIIFVGRNISRISDEYKQYAYNPIKNVYYRIDESHFRIEKGLKKIINNYKNCEMKNIKCDKESSIIVKKTITNNYKLIIKK